MCEGAVGRQGGPVQPRAGLRVTLCGGAERGAAGPVRHVGTAHPVGPTRQAPRCRRARCAVSPRGTLLFVTPAHICRPLPWEECSPREFTWEPRAGRRGAGSQGTAAPGSPPGVGFQAAPARGRHCPRFTCKMVAVQTEELGQSHTLHLAEPGSAGVRLAAQSGCPPGAQRPTAAATGD